MEPTIDDKAVFDLGRTDSRDRYKLLSGLVVPRPIGWIGTIREDGSYNLAPFSFFNVVSTSPPTVIFSAGRHSDRPKDSVTFAEKAGVFTVNIVSAQLAGAMSVTSGSFGPGEDEFAIAGLTPEAGTLVNAPMVAESPANLECRVIDIIDLGREARTRMVIGEVLVIHVRADALDGTRIRVDQIDAIGRMAGNTYVKTRDLFDVVRPA